ncbi:MAG TPA: dienelactone hydrolase family protein [Burkholderiaceae bacterium]|nr:dienelactone hydrolase family protein [Burkholderiaceae bacterium]
MIQQQVLIGPHALAGELALPAGGRGLVLFAHGSGSSRLRPRNRFVADLLHVQRLGTLLFDLLTDTEGRDVANVFDIALLAQRLLQAMAWVRERPDLRGLRAGLFGASTGAAAALVAAAERPHDVSAIVSRSGRPDLAGPALAKVGAPTLLLVGALDAEVLAHNRDALRQLTCEKRLEVIPRATHLFEEAGTLERAAHSACDWLASHLGAHGAR